MKKSTLKKLAAAVPQNDDELNTLLTETITAQTTREKAVADRDDAFNQAKEQLEKEHGWNATIEEQDKTIARNLELLETWTVINQKRLGDARSIVINGHRFGHRLGKWKTAATEKWEKVVENLTKWMRAGKDEDADDKVKERAAIAAEYLVFSCSPDKNAMLRDRDVKSRRAVLEKAGVEFEQEESFFLDPDREGQQPARLEAA